MTLRDEALRLQAPKGPSCSVGELLKSGSGPELAEALADDRLTPGNLARALRARGIAILPQTIRRHRKGECRCGR